MKKTVSKILLVCALVMAITASSVVGTFAMSWNDVGNYFEKNAEDYADQIEQLVDEIGQGYEDNAEQYPDNAQENPEAPKDYVETSVALGQRFLSGIKSLTGGFLKTFKW